MKEFKHYFLINGICVYWNCKLLPKNFEAITLFGHVFTVYDKESLWSYLDTYWGRVMVNHERIHMLQAQSFKLKYFTFYILYYWIIRLFQHIKEPYFAYYTIPFEKEAYRNDKDFSYSKSEWKKYI